MLQKILPSYNEKQIKKIKAQIPAINTFEEEFQKLSETELKAMFKQWKIEFAESPSLVDLKLPEVFAAIKNASRRLMGHTYDIRGKQESWEMIPYDVQLIGGIVLHQGKVAEMRTGEGKTLVSTLPVILNALTGKGVHVVTVNDYLAQRDAEWMTPLYEYCGLSVGVIVNGKDSNERKEAYLADITYGTNNEFGFDYLRDNMAQSIESQVQRGNHFAIVDEVDSILIDEARTPLIISAPANESTEKYLHYSKLIPQLKENQHFNIDIKQKAVHLTEEGVKEIESLLGVGNIFTESGFGEVHHIEQALKAEVIMKKDIDYVIQHDKVIIIDEFTGRMMDGRRFSDGLHQALEAKENVSIQRESKTLATITFQNYFRLYEKLAGMTGTAETEAEEFAKIYKLDTIVIPTNKPIARQDLPDKIFQNEKGKFLALAEEVKKLNKNGQPVLIGTISIERSEILSSLLKREGVKHEILNAKHHEREAEIVAKAGQKGSVTIATNMAGRGTDIKINQEVKDLGGLAILGTERHESRRIDNQLRGRSGRQGDPGVSQFYVAMSDELMRRFGGEKMAGIMVRMNLPETESIENRMISRSVENAQKKIEGFHFDARKHVVQYDDIMNIHREKIYTQRRKMLSSGDIMEDIDLMIKDLCEEVSNLNCPSEKADKTWNSDEVYEIITQIHSETSKTFSKEILSDQHFKGEVIDLTEEYLLHAWEKKKKILKNEAILEISKQIILRSIDELWLEHIDEMTHLRDRVALSGYAQKDPIMEYKAESFRMFSGLLQNIRMTSISNLFRVQFVENLSFDPTDFSEATTNINAIEAALENTGEFDPNKLSRQQRRAQARKDK